MKKQTISHRTTSIILSILMLVSMIVLPDSAALVTKASAETVLESSSGGQITEVPEGYTAVRTMEDLYAIRSNPGGKFILMNDIDMSGTAPGGEWDGGNGWTSIPSFEGIFDGNGYTISNLNFYGPVDSVAFITLNYGTVKNMNITNMTVTGSILSFGFIGMNSGNLSNLHFEDLNIDIDAGSKNLNIGTVARTSSNSIELCSVKGTIKAVTTGSAYVGGIVGIFDSLQSGISQCFNSAEISVTGNSDNRVGGIVGSHLNSKTEYENSDYKYSDFSSDVQNCYNNGSILCETGFCGGIVGYSSGHLYSLYHIYKRVNTVKCINFTNGRICGGRGDCSSVTDSFCLSGSTFGQDGIELTAPLMKQQASYLDFDFTNTWEMFNGRPQLKNNPEFIPTKVTVKQAPSKIIYNAGEGLIVDGTLEVTCKDGTVGIVDITPEMVSGVTKNAGTQTVTITYKDFSVTASVPVEINEMIPDGYTPIYNIAQLYAIRQKPTGNYILMNDIDLSATMPGGEWDGGNGWTPIPKFSGTLDGNGYTISNVFFYGSIDNAFINRNSGTVRNMYIKNVSFFGSSNSAFIMRNTGTVDNIYINNLSVTGLNSFAFVGQNDNTISNLHFDNISIEVDSGNDSTICGAIVRANIGNITLCSVKGSIKVLTTGMARVGGIAGFTNTYSTISECFNNADIFVNGNSSSMVGGIVGDHTNSKYDSYSRITNSYYNGTIQCKSGSCGGITGYSAGEYEASTKTYSYSEVAYCVNFTDGRICGGKGKYSSIDNCYCLSGSPFGQGGTELTAPLMKQQASYLDFDFTNTWEMFNGRPQLKNNPEFKPVSMQFKQRPTKLSFYCGDSFAVDGTLEVTYTDGVVLDMPITENMASGYDMTKLGSQTVTVTLGKIKLTYPINVLEVFATGVKLDKTSEKIVKGNSLQLKATITPDNTTNKTITWTSSNETVATVDSTGKVTAVAPGKATITAVTSNGKKATCTVTVIIPAENITLDKTYAPINKGETLTLVPTVTPSDSTDKLTWASSNESVATVDNSGKITAKGAGTANITVTAERGVFASCFVEVVAPAKSLTISSQSLDMIAGGSETLTLTVDPSDSTDGIEWSVSDDAVSLQVSDDKKTATVYANYAGSADITVVSDSGVETVCSVSIVRNADSISFSEYYKTLEKGDEYTIIPILAPQDCTDKITWHSDNTRAVTVDNNGKITAVGKGTANVSAQITNGLTATIAVTVTFSPTELKLDRSTVDIVGNSSVQVNASVEPDDADKTITWSSSDNGIAYVDSYGNIYGVSSGKAVVTATTQNGLTANCTVNVQFIDISKANIKLSYSEVQYDGYDKTPDVTVTLDGKELQKDTDYTVIYSNNNNVGTATVTVIGIGDYEGKASKTFTITQPPKINILTCTATLNQTVFYYDGNEKKPGVTVKNGSTRLYESSDYTLSYSNNRNIGTGKVTINGIGGYTGTKELTFSIEEAPKTDISGCKIALTPTSYTYNGTAREPRVTVKDGYTTLYEGTDYTVSYSNNVNVGTAVVTVSGIGNYTGSKQATFTIDDVARKNIANCTVTLSKTSYVYDGTAKRPTVTVKDSGKTLSYGQDYTIEYTNNLRVGTATVTVTGVGNYTGAKNVSFTINSAPKTDIVNCTITLSQSVYTYDGTAKRPSVTVKRGAATLIVNTDYTVSYSNNTNVGTAKVTVTGKGNYSGTKSATFIIKSPTPVKTPFTWGSDNWNFIKATPHIYKMNSSTK